MKRIDYPAPVIELIGQLKRLPGIGPRGAERIALWMIQNPDAKPSVIAKTVAQSTSAVQQCEVCGFFATASHCEFCEDELREADVLCVVEQPTDVLPIERTGGFKGRYHALGGRIAPLDHVAPEDLRIEALMQRLGVGGFSEIILALSADVEGEATAHYLADLLKDHPIKVTRIAQGLPAGGGLEHADELTVTRALANRRAF